MTNLPCIVRVPLDWSLELAHDVHAAQYNITLSALSMLPPRGTTAGPWPTLWRALCIAVDRKVNVNIFLAAAMPAHPATMQNSTSANIAHARGMQVFLIPGPRLLHAKQCILDHKTVWIGSGNFTSAAAAHNHEVWARFENDKIAADLLERLAGIK